MSKLTPDRAEPATLSERPAMRLVNIRFAYPSRPDNPALDDLSLLYTGMLEQDQSFWEGHNTEDSWTEDSRTFYRLERNESDDWHPNQCLRLTGDNGFEALVRTVTESLAHRVEDAGYRLDVTVPDEPLSELAIDADAMFVPRTFLLGGAWRGSSWTAALDLSWRRWSRYRAPFSFVTAQAPVPLSPTGELFTVESELGRPETRDIFRVAAHGCFELGGLPQAPGSCISTILTDLMRNLGDMDARRKRIFLGFRWKMFPVG